MNAYNVIEGINLFGGDARNKVNLVGYCIKDQPLIGSGSLNTTNSTSIFDTLTSLVGRKSHLNLNERRL